MWGLKASLVNVVERERLCGVGAILIHLGDESTVLMPPRCHNVWLGKRHACSLCVAMLLFQEIISTIFPHWLKICLSSRYLIMSKHPFWKPKGKLEKYTWHKYLAVICMKYVLFNTSYHLSSFSSKSNSSNISLQIAPTQHVLVGEEEN